MTIGTAEDIVQQEGSNQHSAGKIVLPVGYTPGAHTHFEGTRRTLQKFLT